MMPYNTSLLLLFAEKKTNAQCSNICILLFVSTSTTSTYISMYNYDIKQSHLVNKTEIMFEKEMHVVRCIQNFSVVNINYYSCMV